MATPPDQTKTNLEASRGAAQSPTSSTRYLPKSPPQPQNPEPIAWKFPKATIYAKSGMTIDIDGIKLEELALKANIGAQKAKPTIIHIKAKK